MSPVLLKIRHILLLLLKLAVESLQSAVDLLGKVFLALARATCHEHDLFQAVEHDRPDRSGALSDEVLQPGPLDMPEAQEDFDTKETENLPASH